MPNAAASRLVLEPFSEARVTDTARSLLAEIGGRVSCAFVFASREYREMLPDFLELIQVHGHVPTIAGCSGAGLLHTAVEVESAVGFSVLFLHLPDTEVRTVAFGPESSDWPQARADETFNGWIILGDPTSMPVEPWLRHWNATHPGVPCLGGLASGSGSGEEFFVSWWFQHNIGAAGLGND